MRNIIENVKIRVFNENDFQKIQRIAFDLGFHWVNQLPENEPKFESFRFIGDYRY